MPAYLRSHPRIFGLVTVVLVLAVWEWAPHGGLFDPKLLPPASIVFDRFLREWVEGAFYVHLGATLLRVAVGLALAAFVMIPVGLAMGYWRAFGRMFTLTIDVIRPIPSTAFVPVAIIAFGIASPMHVFVVFLATSVPLLLASIDGVRTVDPVLINTARTFRRSTPQIFRTVLLPAALPHIVTSLRVAIALALIVAVASEMVMSAEGLGWRVLYAQRILDIPGLYAGVLTLAVVGYVLNRLFVMLEYRVIGWHRRSRAKSWG
jgi:ABC-type nitrate/sulfonate/bicarbonate transport system permease component